jgi:hypothetical protein
METIVVTVAVEGSITAVVINIFAVTLTTCLAADAFRSITRAAAETITSLNPSTIVPIVAEAPHLAHDTHCRHRLVTAHTNISTARIVANVRVWNVTALNLRAVRVRAEAVNDAFQNADTVLATVARARNIVACRIRATRLLVTCVHARNAIQYHCRRATVNRAH